MSACGPTFEQGVSVSSTTGAALSECGTGSGSEVEGGLKVGTASAGKTFPTGGDRGGGVQGLMH